MAARPAPFKEGLEDGEILVVDRAGIQEPQAPGCGRGSDFSQISAEEPLRKIRRKLSEGDAEIAHVFLADAVDGPYVAELAGEQLERGLEIHRPLRPELAQPALLVEEASDRVLQRQGRCRCRFR
jgi:hypothetical protein